MQSGHHSSLNLSTDKKNTLRACLTHIGSNPLPPSLIVDPIHPNPALNKWLFVVTAPRHGFLARVIHNSNVDRVRATSVRDIKPHIR